MKKSFLLLIILFLGISTVQAKSIRSCTYNTDPKSYDGHKYVLKIEDDYSYTFYSYTYNHNKFSYNAGKKYKFYNWDTNLKNAIKKKEKCPPYLVNAPSNFWGEDKYYIYFNKEKAEKRAKDAFAWLGFVVDLTEDKDLREQTDGKTDLEDKQDGETSVENKDNDDIKEYKKTYPLGSFSNDLSGQELIFYTKYNLTKKQSLSTQITIEGNERKIGLIYPGGIDDFNKNIIQPIVNGNKWPSNFFCGELSSYLLVNPNANVTVILGTARTGDLVCSPDRNAFVDGTNKLSAFVSGKVDKFNNQGDQQSETDYMKPKEACEVIDTSASFYINLKTIVRYIQIGTILLILVLGMFDLLGAVGSAKEGAFKKAIGKFGKRLLAGTLVFLVPALVNIIINLMNMDACGTGIGNLSNLFR